MAKTNYTKFLVFFVLVIVTFFQFGHGYQAQSLLRAATRFTTTNFQLLVNNTTNDKAWENSSTEDADGDEEVESYSGDTTADDDLIVHGLPGQPSQAKFKQYAGYVNVNKKNGRSLFYYFAEAVHTPAAKPLILWLNGGPGCSSFGLGAFDELGPFGVNPDGKTLYARKFAWNRVANVLFLESPAGVGFSYSNTSSDYNTSGDKRTAQDAYKFIINWLRKYPHYKNRDFYIIGESYAGHYIPQLADLIVTSNKLPKSTVKIQLKGIMIGNGVLNVDTDNKGFVDYLWSHALISDETHLGLQKYCLTNSSSKQCSDFSNAMNTEIGSDNIDPYNIYGPLCLDSNSPSTEIKNKKIYGYYPCGSDYVRKYLNLPKVQEALHANTTKLPFPWSICSPVITKWIDSPPTMIPIYKRLIASRLQILIFSGDVDAVVPVTATRYSLDAMNLRVLKTWHPWHYGSKSTQVTAGYKVVYEGLTFATVKGSGHEVPKNKPQSAFALLNTFIANHKH
ncbi:unnamed protein product [Cuscuta epithymum]|uniref:Carboxypeptidase n=2 Tax=Cuscuta epithymum TaxID=186058 RepID=A0AAV0EKM1_9ASTE|nr:unnamed protein product [Cuscuta epithymum]